jgi:hypothetical protein
LVCLARLWPLLVVAPNGIEVSEDLDIKKHDLEIEQPSSSMPAPGSVLLNHC